MTFKGIDVTQTASQVWADYTFRTFQVTKVCLLLRLLPYYLNKDVNNAVPTWHTGQGLIVNQIRLLFFLYAESVYNIG